MHIYHYCAIYQEEVSSTNYIDGMFFCSEKIENIDNYNELKKAIKRDQKISSHKPITIQSLSYHGESDND